MEIKKPLEPYRVLFPLGIAGGFSGVFLWVLFGFGFTLNYPGTAHPDVMIGGFLFAFATGFLMTAIPRFTGAQRAMTWEIYLAGAIITTVLVSDFVLFIFPNYRQIELALSFLNILLVMRFAYIRFKNRSHQPPPFFIFIGIGLLLGSVGILLLFFAELGWASDSIQTMGRQMYYQGMMLALLLGVGSRLIPALLGWAVNPIVGLSLSHGKKQTLSVIKIPLILGTLFIFSFPIDLINELSVGRVIRAVIVTLLAFGSWKIHRKSPTKGVLPFWLRVSGFFLVLGLWGYALSTPYAITFLHLAFIGGFSLVTLLIATRVTLSHGGYGTNLEEKSPHLKWCALLFCVSAIARAAAQFTPSSYSHHLAYASLTWVFGLIIWIRGFGLKLIRSA